MRRSAVIGAALSALLLSACGGGKRQDADEPSGSFPVSIQTASFPTKQTIAQDADLKIVVRNTGSKTIPNVAVTLLDSKYGTAAQAFSTDISEGRSSDLASRSRAVWIIDTPPGPAGHSSNTGGPGAGTTASTNTWALGTLAPGHSTTFDWKVTAVQAGKFTVKYQVSAGLAGKAQAVLSGGGRPQGQFAVTIATQPRNSYVNAAGQPVSTG